jgi:ABC-2 type transport system permease protein
LKDFLRIRRIVIWLLVAGALFAVTKIFTMVRPGETFEATYTQMSGIFIFRVLALASAIFATAVISAEVEQKTIVYLLTRPVQRWKLLLFRTLAAITAVIVVGILAVLVVSFAVYGGDFLKNEYMFRDFKGILAGAAMYTSFFTLLSLIINRSMIVSLLYAFGWETMIPNIPGDMRYLSIGSYIEAICERPSVGANGGGVLNALAGMNGTTMLPSVAWTVSIISIVVCLVVGCLWFSNFEYLPREDVE